VTVMERKAATSTQVYWVFVPWRSATINGIGVAITVDDTNTVNIAAIRPEMESITCAGFMAAAGFASVSKGGAEVDITQPSKKG